MLIFHYCTFRSIIRSLEVLYQTTYQSYVIIHAPPTAVPLHRGTIHAPHLFLYTEVLYMHHTCSFTQRYHTCTTHVPLHSDATHAPLLFLHTHAPLQRGTTHAPYLFAATTLSSKHIQQSI